MAVRSDIGHYNQPKQYFSEKALAFFKECLGLDPERVALQFEAWCVSGINRGKSVLLLYDTKVLTHRITDIQVKPKRTASEEISQCRTIIQEGLSM